MAFRGRGGGNRLTHEMLGVTKEQFQASVEPPLAFPPRTPTSAPPPITDEIQHMLDVGASIKKDIRAKMESGDFHPNLGVPLELLAKQEDPNTLRKKASKKKRRKNVTEHLKKLENEEEEAAKSDDEKPGELQEEEDSDEERHDSDDSGSDEEDDEMDEGNDYAKDYYNEEEEDAAPDEDEGYDEHN